LAPQRFSGQDVFRLHESRSLSANVSKRTDLMGMSVPFAANDYGPATTTAGPTGASAASVTAEAVGSAHG